MNDQKEPVRSWSNLLVREPLVSFVLLGVVVYGLWALFAPVPGETVVIDPAALRLLEQQQVDLIGRSLTEDERAEIRAGYIDDEILLREALRRGLQFSDYRARRRLVRIMRSALTQQVADPSTAQLQAYFKENIDRYTSDESVSLELVNYPWGEEVNESELARLRTRLEAGASPEQYGVNTFNLSGRMPRASRVSLVTLMGAAFADSVLQLPVGGWHGPIESAQGVHLVRVVEVHPSEVASFESVESYLRQDFIMTRTREIQQGRVDEIREQYRIVIAEE